jgi:hypothetical protein
MLFLAICLGAAAQINPEKATMIIKTTGNEQYEVKIAGVEPIQQNQEFVFLNLNEGTHLVTLHKIVSAGYNQPTKKQMVYRGNLTATKGMVTTYHLDRNVMRTGEKVAIAPNGSNNGANQHGTHYGNGYQYGWNNNSSQQNYHPNFPQYANCGSGNNYHQYNCNSGCAPTCGHQNTYGCGCNQPRPPHQCGQSCASGCQFYGNTGFGYINYGQYGYNNSWNFGNGFNPFNGFYDFGNQNGWNNGWNNGYNQQGYNQPPNNSGYDPNWNNYGNRNAMSSVEFSQLMSQIQDEFTDASKMQLIKLAINQRLVTVDQVKSLVKEVTFESSKLDAAKYLYPRTVNQQQYYLVNDVFTFDSSKQELSEFILQ